MKITLLIIILSMCFTNDNEEYKYYKTKFEELNLTVPDVITNEVKCIEGDCNNGVGRFVLYTPMYEGGFKDKNRHGEGIQVWSNGDYVHGMCEAINSCGKILAKDFPIKDDVKASFSSDVIKFAVPSAVFKATLPVKPSVTITLTRPSII